MWASTYPTRLKRIHLLQKRLIRIITNSSYLSHTKELFKQEGLLNIYDINKLETAIFMYKFDTDQYFFFQLNSNIHYHNTRQSQSYHIVSKKTKLGQFSISYRGPKVWNSFSHMKKDSRTLRQFKKLVKNKLLEDMSST